MSTYDKQTADRQARYRARKKHVATAELAGADILDATIVTRAPDGHYVVFLHDGKPLHLIDRPDPVVAPVPVESEPEPVPETAKPPRKKAIVVPREIVNHSNAAVWDNVTQQVINKQMSPDKVKTGLPEIYEKHTNFDGDIVKMSKQIAAMVDALTDQHGDEWRSFLPTWPEEK